MDIIDAILHINTWLQSHQGPITYVVIFVILFCETGLFFTPFLPGDSLLFAVGALGASGGMDLRIAVPVLVLAGVLGDTSNYNIGRLLGPRVFRNEKVRFLNRAYLDRAHAFYEKHGGKTVVLGHFFPIIRTFVPFVAGMGSMTFGRFLRSNILGITLWVALFLNLGWWVGSIPYVQAHFGVVEILIIAISCIPAALTILKERAAAKARKAVQVLEEES